MKKRDALEALQKAFQKLKAGGVTKIGFVSVSGPSSPKSVPAPPDPEFEFGGWRFYAKTAPWEDETTDGGDARVAAPDGQFFGLAWTVGSAFHHVFDFSQPSAPMLYVSVPASVRRWEELRQQLLQLVPEPTRELETRDRG